MMSLARFFPVLFLVFFSLGLVVIAQSERSLTLKIEDVASEVEVGGTAAFTLFVTNIGEERDVYKIGGDPYDISPFSNFVQYVTIDPNQVKVDSGETVAVNVTVKVLDTAPPDQLFQTDVSVASLIFLKVKESIPAKVHVVSKKDVVQITTDLPQEVRPGDTLDFEVVFKNRLNVALEHFEISLYSDLPGISTSEMTTFSPKEQRTGQYTFPIRMNSPPGDYALHVKVYDGEDLKGSFAAAFRVAGKPSVEEKTFTKGGFLQSSLTLERKNGGNVRSTQRILVESNFLKNIFSSTNPKATVEQGNLVWEFELEPGEVYTVHVIRDYRSLFYGFLIVVVAVILFYFYIERSVVVKKRIFRIKAGSDGISEIKVLLLVRNGRRRTLHGVKVMDILPNIIEPTYEFGTLKPDNVQKGSTSRRFIWELGRLEPGEERVFTYKVKAKLHLGEGALLPAASLHYMIGSKLVATRSRRLEIVRQGAGN